MNRTKTWFWRRPRQPSPFAQREAYPGLYPALPLVGFALVLAVLTSGPVQAGRWLPEVENPYCAIKTYTLRDVAEQASSMTDRLGRPVIVVNTMTLRRQPAYSKFLMAHECCHHSLGHVANFKKELGHLGPQAYFYLAPELRRLELEADCCAIKLLRERRDLDGIEAGRAAMALFGPKQTGAHYPTGIERADNIVGCAAADD